MVPDHDTHEVDRTGGKSAIGSQAGRLNDAFATNHKDVCDVFQAALSGVKGQNGDSVVQNFVYDNIPSFPREKTGHLMDVYEVAREAMISELQYSAAYHNASLVRDVCANIFKSWNFDSLCDSVATLIASEGLRDIYKNECMISQYLKMEGNRGQTCVLGTHHNSEIHRLERLVTENGLDCIVYRILRVIQGCLRPEMFPSGDVLTLDFMTIEDNQTLQHTSMTVWALFNSETDLTKLPSTLINTYISMHEGEPLASAIRGCQDFKDFSFDALTIVQAEMFRIITMYMTRRLSLTHGTSAEQSHGTRGTTADQSPVPNIENLLSSAAKGKQIV